LETIHNLLYGFSVVADPINLLFCLIGVFLGTLVGVLPGLGPAGAIAILMPVSFQMSPVSAIIMLAGIYYGAQYGGSTTSILVNIPGEASSIVTCLDGYEMAKKGRAGPALGIAAFGSFISGTIGIVGLMFFAGPLAEFGLKFGPAEYFSVVLLGLMLVVYLSQGSVLKGLMMGSFGIILSCVGLDHMTASPRLTFNILRLLDGLDMGLFGIGEILVTIEESANPAILKTSIKGLFPSLEDWRRSKGPILRGTVLGFFLGILPGGGALISSFASYGLEKKLSKHPEEFGKGAIEGVAGPESANNAAASGAFIPLLALGIPPNLVMALLFGALMIHGVTPGPLLLGSHPEVFWGVVSSMYIGNIMLLLLNLPLIPMWVQVLKVPYRTLFPLILLFCMIGAYSLKGSAFDLAVMIVFGIMGYLFRRFRYEAAPLILAFVLGPILEVNLRQSLIYSRGSFLIFFTRPISALFIALALVMVLSFLTSFFLRLWRSSSGRPRLPHVDD
jgi:putative tricarboxylic transport membrane protein